jgi:hypothetical protein
MPPLLSVTYLPFRSEDKAIYQGILSHLGEQWNETDTVTLNYDFGGVGVDRLYIGCP